MKKNHKYDTELIEKLVRKQPEENFNMTDVAKKYCKAKGIDFSVYRARAIQYQIKINQFHTEIEAPKKSAQFTTACKRTFIAKKGNFIIVWAQARTPIHDELWDNILAYAKKHKAQIIVIPGTYLNNNDSHNFPRIDCWDSKLTKYLYATEAHLHKNLAVVADTDIVPTAKQPLTGFHNVTGLQSSIVGHPKQHMAISPTMKNRNRKFMFSTGAITIPNYRKARAGKEASIHHKMGFLFVENINEDNFVARHIHAEDDGSFQDLSFRVADGKVTNKESWKAMVFGDTHLGKEDQQMLAESRRLITKVGCEQTIWHDLFDGSSINHHASKDYVAQVIKAKKGTNLLANELQYNWDFIEQWKDTNMVSIPSNHNDWLDKWVCLNQGVKDVQNAYLFNEFQNILINEKAPKGLYSYLVEERFPEVKCLERDISYEICGIEVNNHGDLGSNGAKGTPLTFAKLPHPVISGDKHHAYTYNNTFGVGISCVMDHGYNRGMSSWCQSNGIILNNGRFQHLLYFDGKFTNLI